MIAGLRSLSVYGLFVSFLASAGAGVVHGQEGQGVYKKLMRSVVWVVVPESQTVSPTETGVMIRTRISSGTGSLIDLKRRLVLTNYHVVTNKELVFVMFPVYQGGKLRVEKEAYRTMLSDGLGIRARVKARDRRRDLALLELEQVPPDAQALRLARDSAGPGQRVHSIGNPGASGALWVYTSGTVRTQPYRGQFRSETRSGRDSMDIDARVIETQSPTNEGDSGGPLVNDRGELVAVTQGGAVNAQQISLFIDVSEVAGVLVEAKIKPTFASAKDDTKAKARPAPEKSSPKPEEAAAQKEQRAASKLKYAKIFFEEGNRAYAQKYCEDIVTQFPQTKAATEAKELLGKIKKKGK